MSYTVCSQGGVNISGDGSMDNFELKSSYKNSSNFLIFTGHIFCFELKNGEYFYTKINLNYN